MVRRRRSKWQEQDAAPDVDTQRGPCVDTAAISPCILRPRVLAVFSTLRHRVKCPNELARSHVECANIASWSARFSVGHKRAAYHQILVDERRRRHAVTLIREFVCYAGS